jgi:hypothetical protein
MDIADLALMSIRVETDFTIDARGRLVASNEPHVGSRRPAPQLFLGLTRDGHLVRFGATVPDALAQDLAAFLEHVLIPGELTLPPATASTIRAMLERHAAVTLESSGPAYRFPAMPAPDGDVVQLTRENRALARETYPWLEDELPAWQPCFAAVEGGRAVAACFTARLGPAAAEAGVYTIEGCRQRGYAAAVTSAWGQEIHASGLIPLYSANWTNEASRGVARRLGLIPFGTDASWT